MPHYYLNIEQDNEVIEDLEGGEFDSVETARQKALASARGVMSDRAAQGKAADGSSINIVDVERRSVLRVPIFETTSIK